MIKKEALDNQDKMPIDLRNQKLAKLVVNYSIFAKPKETVVVCGGVEAQDFILAIYKELILKGTYPILRVLIPGAAHFYYKYAKKHQLEKHPVILDFTAKIADKYIFIDSLTNTKELTSTDPKKIIARQKITHPITEYIVNGKPNIYRCSVASPCLALAQEAEMSETEYENFVYRACLQDWKTLSKSFDKIKKKFKENSKVHLLGSGVDLEFKVHGNKAVIDSGKENMPGGEVFMAPVRNSLNGYIKFDYPAIRGGKEVTDIELKFKDGKVIEAKASKNQDFLNEMLNTDKNASYVGEFGIGCNPKITKFTKNLLFDEKIGGTIHLALGAAYKENGGGNDSAIHWDIVNDMSKAKMIVDNKIIQENGKWKL